METVAVLVDGDNLSAKYAGQIALWSRDLGTVTVRRVYLDAQKTSDWQGGPKGFRLMHAGTGKNASDLLLALDAMELALREGVNRFVIASSDRDFSHLALRLREYGRQVTGIGETKTPKIFRDACETFLTLSPPAQPKEAPQPVAKPMQKAAPPPAPKAAAAPVPELDRKIMGIIAEYQEPGLGLGIVRLQELISSIHKVKIGDTPEGTWRAYLTARPTFYDLDPRGPQARVRPRQASAPARLKAV
ncbi:NYN domain-containing protein [Rhodobacter capsulatus]|uniref:NYN domain-containing protein n=1 Tax=Rhodobacter capsulatus TaxID=1061 RepID=A0A1G7D605_RHOCA|nr:NYN domain-containing protein [Rhodobacter capsulatus]WER10907.1 NYN domain-containing protein [Rhodobacter capsulatus]SDE47058.1 NYN domain-containing protein [Rhodobacter capsulatus]